VKYYVIGDDGQKYGPADLALLNSWIAEGRLMPTQQLEDESSGMRIAAGAVQGLSFPLQNPQSVAAAQQAANPPTPGASPYASGASPYANQGAQPYQSYARQVGDDGSGDLKVAYICAAIGFFCCFSFIPAFIYLNKATSKGNPNAGTAKLVIWIIVAVWLAVGVFRAFYVFNHMPNFANPPIR